MCCRVTVTAVTVSDTGRRFNFNLLKFKLSWTGPGIAHAKPRPMPVGRPSEFEHEFMISAPHR